MTQAIETARAMIALLDRSPWREVQVRTAGVELFLAKPGGGANPMRVAAVPAPAAAVVVSAPHVATFVSAMPVGSWIAAGEAVCRLDVLGETIDVFATAPGTIAAVQPARGDLVEYGASLVMLR